MMSFSAWALWLDLRFCECDECYGRYLFRERSFTVQVTPAPLPRFYAWVCDAGWYVGLGWFRVFVARSKEGARARRKAWLNRIRD
jgi:hypothetical protein